MSILNGILEKVIGMRICLLLIMFLISFQAKDVLAEPLGGQVCGVDINNDGRINSAGEFMSCIDGVCPHDMVACNTNPGDQDVPLPVTCPLGDFPCVDINNNGRPVCSAIACVDQPTGPSETSADLTGFQNDGIVNQATGACSGVFKIFNGQPGQCLPRGWDTTFFDCCDADEDSWWFLREHCSNQSLTTAQAITAGRAHYVGEYCSRDEWLLGCIQDVRTYCTFNSRMARIIHEQGRSQLQKFGGGGGWGSVFAPNCEGFTPEEFQMLDFSKIDLSELFGHITPLPAGQLLNDVQGAFDSLQDNLR